MPELPEVETVVRALRDAVTGARIVRVAFASRRISQPNPTGWRNDLEGRILESVSRRGKYIILEMAGGGHLVAHLRMTGRFRLLPASQRRGIHDRLILQVLVGSPSVAHQLVLVDARQFARADWCGNGALGHHPGLNKLGPEADEISEIQLRRILARSHRPIKSLLLDQTALAGLGNIYADESLFAASVHPRRPSDMLDRGELRRLRLGMRRILAAAIEASGTTFDTFSDLEGNAGGFAPSLNVYHRDGSPCRQCSTLIDRITLAGRGTHFCPNCQRL